jgi:hypothetical protein
MVEMLVRGREKAWATVLTPLVCAFLASAFDRIGVSPPDDGQVTAGLVTLITAVVVYAVPNTPPVEPSDDGSPVGDP